MHSGWGSLGHRVLLSCCCFNVVMELLSFFLRACVCKAANEGGTVSAVLQAQQGPRMLEVRSTAEQMKRIIVSDYHARFYN